jgi:hypothetical protein
MGIGFAVAARNWWIGIILALMLLAIYLPVIRGEEVFLREKFPEFQEYASKVPRMIPRITPAFREESRRGFSIDLYLKHREYNALIGAVAMFVGLIAKMEFFRI